MYAYKTRTVVFVCWLIENADATLVSTFRFMLVRNHELFLGVKKCLIPYFYLTFTIPLLQKVR